MRKPTLIMLCISFFLLPAVVRAQAPGASSPPDAARAKRELPANRLLRVKTVVSLSETATTFGDPLLCDSDSRLYLQSEHYGVSGIRKLSANGDRLALFLPNPDLKVTSVGYFALGKGGELYQLAFLPEITRYLLDYKSDGSYKSSIKLQPGFPWMPSTLAVFPSGNFLISGQEYDRGHLTLVKVPFTGIFSSDGKLEKEVKPEDDQALYQAAVNGDSRVASPEHGSANLAIELSEMETASDGNVYLMRWFTPAIFYAISETGDVVRRFTVDPGYPNYRPAAMHISGNRIAVLFFHPQTMDELMKVVDLEGHEISTLPLDEKPEFNILGLAFACYSGADPQRFTFLATGKDERLEFRIAEPQ